MTVTEPYCADCGRCHAKHAPTIHPQVHVQVGNRQAHVDQALAPLIRELWRAGIDTNMSCQQDGHGLVWIQLPPASAEAFLNIVAGNRPADSDLDPDSLYNRVIGDLQPSDLCGAWRLEAAPCDFAAVGMPADIDIAISVRFPPADLPAVLDCLQAHNGDPDDRDALLARLADALRTHEFDAAALAALTSRHVDPGMEILARYDLADEIDSFID
ncbi:MAG TPA: hypothetical protein VGQ26_14095 [Streptosporangiaceae bacterium]|jgi:hypothetical protein|nr:hypothetical protein [Streptosporangiaceae bacterium]